VNGGRDLIYWAAPAKGIAFQFYYNGRLNKRRLASTIVFERGVEFLPEGCVSPPQELRKVEPFTIESPMVKSTDSGQQQSGFPAASLYHVRARRE
jgi:hypothetical protein